MKGNLRKMRIKHNLGVNQIQCAKYENLQKKTDKTFSDILDHKSQAKKQEIFPSSSFPSFIRFSFHF